MKSTVETLSPTRVRIAVEVPFAELEPNLKKAYRDISAQVNIPGFRKGKVPPAILDQRIGRQAILNEAVQEAIPTQLLAAVREHEVRTLGRPEVEITEFADGQPLRFTAEVDVRPQFTLPNLADVEITVDPIVVTDEEVDRQLEGLRQRFGTLKTVERPAAWGDFVQIDLVATVDGEEVPGGTATNLSYEVGSNELLQGLDETIEGMTAGSSATFTTALVAGDYAGREAEVTVTVKSVKERELPPADDDFAQLASEFDTLEELRADLAERVRRVKRINQLYTARDKALAALIEAADIPTPEGVVREEVEARKSALTDQLEQMGSSLEEYLARENRTEEQLDEEITNAAVESLRAQLLLDAYAEAKEITVTDDEFGHEVVHRAQRAGMSPQQYYDQLMRAGAGAAVYSDVRRGKALAAVLEEITIKDTNGETISLDELKGDAGEDHTGHDHD